MSTANYNALAGTLLTRGRLQPDGTGINAAQTLSSDINVSGTDELVVEADMTGTAIGDLVVTVFPFEADNATVQATPIPQMITSPVVLSGGHVYFYGRYDVSGIERVRISINNANVGAQTITRASWRAAGT